MSLDANVNRIVRVLLWGFRFFTCFRTDLRDVWCCPCGFPEGFCICRGLGARFLDGFCPWQFPWFRHVIGPGLFSEPEINNCVLNWFNGVFSVFNKVYNL